MVDYHSRYPEIARLHNMTLVTVINALKQIFSRYGIPESLHSDNGPQFASTEFRHFSTTYGFVNTTSSPHHPQGNGLVERTVQTVKGLIHKAAFTGRDFYLALMAYRASPHEAKSVSPAQLLMGRRLRTSLPCISSFLQPTLVDRTIPRKRYDDKNGVKYLKKLTPGDEVLIWDLTTHTWKFSALVQRQVHPRSYEAFTGQSTILLRNLYQLQLRHRPVQITQQNRDLEDEDSYGSDPNDEPHTQADEDNNDDAGDVADTADEETARRRARTNCYNSIWEGS